MQFTCAGYVPRRSVMSLPSGILNTRQTVPNTDEVASKSSLLLNDMARKLP